MLKGNTPGKFTPLGDGLHLGFELELFHRRGFSVVQDLPAPEKWHPQLEGYVAAAIPELSVDGAEFLSQPATLEEHRKRLPIFLEYLRDNGFRTKKRERAGFHVHVERGALGTDRDFENNLERLVALLIYGGGAWERYQRRVAGRWAKRWASPGRKWASPRWWGTPSPEERLDLAALWVKQNTSRKSIRINLQHRATLEFRQGAASLDARKLLGFLDFCESVCRYARDTELEPESPRQELARFLEFAQEAGYTLPSPRRKLQFRISGNPRTVIVP